MEYASKFPNQSLHLPGVLPSTISYNIAIKAHAAPPGSTLGKEGLDGAFSLFAHMLGDDIVPDSVTYTSLLGLCGQARQGRRALALFQVFLGS